MSQSISCVISDCSNESSCTSQEIAYFAFPTEPSLLIAWVKAVQQQDSCQPGPDSTICSNHFLREDLLMNQNQVYALRPGSLPQIIPQICRVCFATDIKLYQMAAHKILYEAYETLTGLSLEQEGGLPQLVCAACARRLLNYARLRTGSLRAHLTLLNILNTRGRITKESISSLNEGKEYDSLRIGNHDNSELDETEATVIINRENIYNVNQTPILRIDVDKTENNSEIVYNETSEVTIIKRENYDIIMTCDIVKEEVSGGNEDYAINCDQAENNNLVRQENAFKEYSDTENVNAFKDNSPQVEGVRHQTDISSSGTATTKALEQRTEKPENNEEIPCKFSCDICEYKSTNIVQFLNHLKAHANYPYRCDICSYVTNVKISLKRHVNVCTKIDPKNPHTCPICSNRFQNRKVLLKHLLQYSGKKHFSCKNCDKQFATRLSLNKHIESTHCVTHKCHVCNEEFYKRKLLLSHMRTHVDKDRIYQCDKCKTFYLTKIKFHQHMRTHFSKSIACHICNKSFRYEGYLKNHLMFVHPNCDRVSYKTKKRRFINDSNSHSAGKTYPCLLCKIEFSASSILRQHVLANHF